MAVMNSSTTVVIWPPPATTSVTTVTMRNGYPGWTPVEALDATQIKQLKELLALATRDDDALDELADSLAEAADVKRDDALKTLKLFRALLMTSQLLEKLKR